MAVTLMAVVDGIATTLGTAIGIETTMSFDELLESVDPMDCPRLHVYPQHGTSDPSGNTDRTAFSGGVQQTIVTVIADVFARQRSQLDEDMKATVEIIDALMTCLQTQERPPFFGVVGIKAFNWEWSRETFRYGSARYMGARFRLKVRIY